MISYEQLRAMQHTYLAASKKQVGWRGDEQGDRSFSLAEQISILAEHLADLMIPVAPPPPITDEHVAVGCQLFSNPALVKL